VSEFGLGYRRDLEDFASLIATSKPFVLPEQTFSAPASISHRAWRAPAKNQGQVGSCSGFSRASGEEILNWIATGGMVERFSEMYCYLENQKACGLLGRDQGATIDGSLKASQTTGICREASFPYPGRYVTQIPPAAEIEGKAHLINSHSIMKGYADCLKWISSGVGVVLIGVDWTMGMRNAGKRMTKQTLGGQLLGGHAMVLEGYNDAGDLDLENSHSSAWGDGGWCMVAPEVVDYWGAHGATLIGISDLQSYGYRKITSWGEMFG
jgi:hypothetical protein